MDYKELEQGWKKEMLCIHVSEYDEHMPSKHRTLSYDISNDFNSKQIAVLKNWANEINNRFPNLKISLSGTGYIPNEQNKAN